MLNASYKEKVLAEIDEATHFHDINTSTTAKACMQKALTAYGRTNVKFVSEPKLIPSSRTGASEYCHGNSKARIWLAEVTYEWELNGHVKAVHTCCGFAFNHEKNTWDFVDLPLVNANTQ